MASAEFAASREPGRAAAIPADDETSSRPGGAFEARYRLGEGLRLGSPDARFSLSVRGRLQALATLDLPRDPSVSSSTGSSFDLVFRRARVAIESHLFDADTRLKVEFGLSHRDMGTRDGGPPTFSPVLDYYLELRQLRELNLRVGQFKVPFSRERVISSSRLQMVDRSIVNAELNLDRDVGVTVFSRDLFGLGALRYYLGFFAGEGRDYLPGQGRDDTGFLYTARVEALPFGAFEDYGQGDLERSTSPRVSLGVAYAFLDEAGGSRGILGPASADGGTTDYHFVTADAVLMAGGFSAHMEVIYRGGQRSEIAEANEHDPLGVEAPRNGVGWFLQLGYLLPDVDLELSARYGVTVPVAQTSMPRRSELGVGLAYYFSEHTFKAQLDAFQLWSGADGFETGDQRVRLSVQAFL